MPAIEPSSAARGSARDRLASKRQHQLEQAHHHQRGHAEFPGGDGGRLRIQPLRLEGDERRAEHQQCHADAGGRIQAQRHRGDVVAPAACGQPPRHQCVEQIANQHAERSARKHAFEYHVSGKLEYPDERHRDEAEDGQIVDDQAEEAIEVTGDEPAGRSGRGGRHGAGDCMGVG